MLATPTRTNRLSWLASRRPGDPAAAARAVTRRAQVCTAQRRDPDRAAGQPGAEPHDPAHIAQGRGDHVDPGVGVVDPVHRDLVNAQPGPLRQHEQFGVEEPARVRSERQQGPGRVRADRLEPALRVGEARAEGSVEQQVVAAGNDLAFRAADHPGAPGQPGPDRDVAVPGQQRRDQRQQRVQVSGQVHVHIGVDVGVAAGPDRAQRPAPPGPLDTDRAHQRELGRQLQGLGPGAVGASVVGDRDAGRERKAVIQEGAQPPDGRAEVAFLVADRDHDLDLRFSRNPRGRCFSRGPGSERGPEYGISGMHGADTPRRCFTAP